MKALVFERSLARFAAARVAGSWAPGGGARVGPLHLADVDPPELPGPGWRRITPLLSGICGSDLATVDGRSSRYFEPIVSFPFVPGHELVGHLEDQPSARVVIEPVLGCEARGIFPPCEACAVGDTGGCRHVAFGHLKPGLQTGFCADTGGGWSSSLVAHESQIHPVPEGLSDDDAVMVEPTACGVHAALAAGPVSDATVAVLGSGTLGLTTLAALRRLALPGHLISSAKYPEQRRWARELGADEVVAPDGIARAVRRSTRSLAAGRVLTGGADVVVDCVGSAESIATAVAVVRPRGRVVLAGMPGVVRLDLTPLWHREVQLVGAYAYGVEHLPGRPADTASDPDLPDPGRSGSLPRTFHLALELVAEAGLGRLVGARYPLDRFTEALTHAAEAGRRGTVKVVFDLRPETRRPAWRNA
ncbi:MAG TPA: zinc-binding dehydrogenase [Acidimicrobiales bacterium]|nr:zinc-binding dehydrogenase [Acidimicrobiales bacterium]